MSQTKQDNLLDVRDFRRALAQFPTGVTIITATTDGGESIGVTASSFNSVSVDPPLVLWSVDKSAHSASIMRDAKHFAVNVLSKAQVDMSNRFAGRGEDKFSGVDYKVNEYGSPLFAGCAAQYECKTWNVYEGGDHLIIVGEVLNYSYQEGMSPLVFACGSYAVSMQHPATVSDDSIKVPGDGFLGDYMLYLLRIAYSQYSSKLYPELMRKHNIAPEEWRVLTLLGDSGTVDAATVAEIVGQPMNVFNDTIDRMQDKGFVIKNTDGQLSLTSDGKAMSENLFEIAKEQEQMMLDDLSAEQQASLRLGLQHIAKVNS
ncbi:flavin reductase [Arenicella sp.]|nr:flavin reductase [Arenicella sp.]